MKILETERLVLRRVSSDDAEFILELLNQPSFLRYIGDKGVRTTEDAVRYIQTGPVASYERFGFGLYLVEIKETKVPIGMQFFSERGLEVLVSEVIWVWFPALLIYMTARMYRTVKMKSEESGKE